MVGSNGYELRAAVPADQSINGGAGANKESAVAADTLVRCICTVGGASHCLAAFLLEIQQFVLVLYDCPSSPRCGASPMVAPDNKRGEYSGKTLWPLALDGRFKFVPLCRFERHWGARPFE